MDSSDSWGQSRKVIYFEENRADIHYAFSFKIKDWQRFSHIYTGHIRMTKMAEEVYDGGK